MSLSTLPSRRVFMGESLEWDAPVRVGSHVIRDRFLSSGWSVEWWTSPLSPLHLLRPRIWRQNVRKALRHARGGEAAGPRGRQVTPRVLLPARRLPLLDGRWAAGVQLATFRPDPRPAMRGADLVWVSSVHYLPFLEDVAGPPRVVRLADLDMLYPEQPAAAEEWIRRGIACADLVITPTQAIEDWAREAGCRRTLFLPNGVEVERFEMASAAGGRDRRLVLYAGAISELVDQELAARTAALLPEVRFLFVGPVMARLGTLRRARNVEIAGPLPFAELPRLMASAGACWIPFRRTPRADSSRPLKLFQYLAAGAPAICTPWRELGALAAPVQLASTPGEMAAALREALADPDRGAAERRAFARAHSWKERLEDLERRLEELLAARLSPP